MDFGGAGSWMPQMFQDMREDLWNERAYYQQGKDKQDAQEESKRNRQFQLDMFSNRYRLQTADMMAAGLNPMLAYSQSPGGAPGGSMASMPSSPGHARTTSNAAAMFSAVQHARLVEAQEDLLRAQAGEVRARTPVHGAQEASLRQQVEESKARIEDLFASVQQRGASAKYYEQQVKNLQEEIPKIRTTVGLLKQQTVESIARTGLTQEQAKEVHQRIEQNLPELERALLSLEHKAGMMREESTAAQTIHDTSFVAEVGRVMRALNPFSGIVGALPMGRAVTPKEKPLNTPWPRR